MEKAAPPPVKLRWRFQQAVYRAYYDAYDRSRLLYETELEERAMSQLSRADKLGAAAAMALADSTLDRAVTEPVSSEWRARVFEMAEALFQSIRMQLSAFRDTRPSVGRWRNLDIDLAPAQQSPLA